MYNIKCVAIYDVLQYILTFFCADVSAFTNAYFGEHFLPGRNFTSLRCYGNESRLINCRHSTTTTCRMSRVAGVRCQGETVAGTYFFYVLVDEMLTSTCEVHFASIVTSDNFSDVYNL